MAALGWLAQLVARRQTVIKVAGCPQPSAAVVVVSLLAPSLKGLLDQKLHCMVTVLRLAPFLLSPTLVFHPVVVQMSTALLGLLRFGQHLPDFSQHSQLMILYALKVPGPVQFGSLVPRRRLSEDRYWEKERCRVEPVSLS